MIARIDHFVLTVQSLDATCDFYAKCLDFRRVDSPGRPTALLFGEQKFNVHQADHTFDPKARAPTPGSADFCLVANVPLSDVLGRLSRHRVAVELGPVEREGALGPCSRSISATPTGTSWRSVNTAERSDARESVD
jgi:catechol 2,3-dioxygenase-like lactoylglutathione lyase family enzyme